MSYSGVSLCFSDVGLAQKKIMHFGNVWTFTSRNQMQCYFGWLFIFIHGHLGALGLFVIVEGGDRGVGVMKVL